jgi:hypothetical protein
MVKIATVALVSIMMMASLAASVGASSCCWAKQGQQFHWNATTTSTSTHSPLLTNSYQQWDTQTGWHKYML